MALFENFPYTNLHELNLDWILKEIAAVREAAPNVLLKVIIESAALYTFFVKRVSKVRFSQRCRAFFARMTELGFGVYLVHALVIELVALTGLTVRTMPVLMLPLLTLVVLALSLLLTKLIRSLFCFF